MTAAETQRVSAEIKLAITEQVTKTRHDLKQDLAVLAASQESNRLISAEAHASLRLALGILETRVDDMRRATVSNRQFVIGVAGIMAAVIVGFFGGHV